MVERLIHIAQSPMYIFDLIDQFKKCLIYERGLSHAYVSSVILAVRAFDNFMESTMINEISSSDVRDYLYAQKEQKLWKPKTFKEHRQRLNCFFNWCVNREFVKVNPVSKIETPKVPRQLPRCLTNAQAEKLLAGARWCKWAFSMEPIRNETIIATFIYTGLRKNELLKLRTCDVNIESGLILVKNGKGQKDRTIPIHPKLKPLLKAYMASRQQEGWTSRWFFPSVRSKAPLSTKNLYAICKRIQNHTSVRFTPHMLRHTFARLAVEADLGLYKLKEIMGHSDISTTQIYMSVSPQNIKKSFEKIDML